MRIVWFIALVYVAVVLETTWAPLWAIGPLTPDLLGLLACVWLLVDDRAYAPCWAGAIGLTGDLSSSGRVGAGMAAWLLAGLVLSRLKRRLPLTHPIAQAVVTGFFVGAVSLSLAVVGWLTGEIELALLTCLTRAAGVGIYTAGVSLPLYMTVAWLREPRLRRAAMLEQS